MNFFNYYAAWDSDTSATEEGRVVEGVVGSAATAARELFFLFSFSFSLFLPVFFFFLIHPICRSK